MVCPAAWFVDLPFFPLAEGDGGETVAFVGGVEETTREEGVGAWEEAGNAF